MDAMLPEAQQKKHGVYKTLDAWRGLAALWVVFVHAAAAPNVIQLTPELRRNPIYAVSLLGMLGVQLFFVISGFCIANAAANALDRSGGQWRFLKARLRRIYPPYFFATLAAAGMAIFAAWLLTHGFVKNSSMAEVNPLHQSPLYYFAAMTLTQVPLQQAPIVNVFWTLCYEIAFYLVVFIVLAISRAGKMTLRGLLNALHVVTIASLISLIYKPAGTLFPFNMWPQFGFGVIAYDLIRHPREAQAMFLAIASAIVAMVQASIHNLHTELGKVGTRGQYITCVTFTIILVLMHRKDREIASLRVVRALAFVGTFSYSLYLTHQLSQGIALQLFRRITPIAAGSFAYLFWFQVVLAIPFAFAFFWICERPFLNQSSSGKRPAKMSPAAEAPEAELQPA